MRKGVIALICCAAVLLPLILSGCSNILYLDENGKQQSAYWRYDTINTAWQTNHASLDWFKTEAGEQVKPDVLNRVVGFKIAANMAINVTGEVAHIYFDNFIFS